MRPPVDQIAHTEEPVAGGVEDDPAESTLEGSKASVDITDNDVASARCTIAKDDGHDYPTLQEKRTRDEHFDDALRFDPGRWLVASEEKRGAHDRRAFVPFGGGPRIRPGHSLALLQIQTVLAMLCRNFELAPVRGGCEVGEHLTFTMMPTHLAVLLKLRTHAPKVLRPQASGAFDS